MVTEKENRYHKIHYHSPTHWTGPIYFEIPIPDAVFHPFLNQKPKDFEKGWIKEITKEFKTAVEKHIESIRKGHKYD